MKLYSTPRSPFAARVRIQIRAKRLPIEIVDPPGGPGSAQFRRISAIGRIPVLDTGTDIIAESEVIQEYLEERYPRPSFRGDDAEATARIRLLGRIADLYLVPALLPLRTVVGTTERSEAAVASAAEDLGRVCALLDGYLDAGDPYAVGSRLSLADCALAPLVLYARHFARTLGVDSGLASAPRLARWFESVQADPHVAPVLEQIRAALREVS